MPHLLDSSRLFFPCCGLLFLLLLASIPDIGFSNTHYNNTIANNNQINFLLGFQLFWFGCFFFALFLCAQTFFNVIIPNETQRKIERQMAKVRDGAKSTKKTHKKIFDRKFQNEFMEVQLVHTIQCCLDAFVVVRTTCTHSQNVHSEIHI